MLPMLLDPCNPWSQKTCSEQHCDPRRVPKPCLCSSTCAQP